MARKAQQLFTIMRKQFEPKGLSGGKPQKIWSVDLFPQTPHATTTALFIKE